MRYLSIEILREEANIGIVDLRDDLLQLVNVVSLSIEAFSW